MSDLGGITWLHWQHLFTKKKNGKWAKRNMHQTTAPQASNGSNLLSAERNRLLFSFIPVPSTQPKRSGTYVWYTTACEVLTFGFLVRCMYTRLSG